jgi:hypothetical protein
MRTSVEDGWRGVYPNAATRTSAAPRESAVYA